MAVARSIWSGSIPLAGLPPIAVEVTKGTDAYEGDIPLRQVCECHHEPFVREERCTGGKLRRTAAREKAGEFENTTPVVKAVEDAEGHFHAIDDSTLAEIDEAISSKELTPVAIVPMDSVPMQQVNELWYVRPSRKIKGSDQAVATLAHALDGKALIAKWATRGREHIVAIHPVGNVLCMNRVRYAQEVRPAEENTATAPEKAVTLMSTFLGQVLPTEVDFATLTDASVEARGEAIDAALLGKPIAKAAEKAVAAETPDLTAALEASIAAVKPKSRKKVAA